jgi:RNA polymerase sigma-70 factor (ECF subfamily)
MNRSDDSRLVAGLKARDQRAVRELSDRYGSTIYQLAFRHLKSREDAEEVTQDVLLKVYRKIDAFRGDSALSSWIYRITFNTAMSRLRNSRVQRAAERPDQPRVAESGELQNPRQLADWSAMPDEELLRAQLRHAVASAIRDLPPIYRAPVVLRDIEGLSTEEASTRLHVKDQTLKSRLHRGRLMLRARLQNFTSGLNLHRQTPAFG